MTELHNNIENIPPEARGAVAAIGNFDGVHPGHAALVDRAGQIAKEAGAPHAVLTFEPHPREFFQQGGEPFRLTLLPMKRRIFGAHGVGHVFAPAFDAAFAQLTADEFVNDVLVKQLGLRHVVVGPDFAFGKGRSGSVQTLQDAQAKGLFGLTVMEHVMCSGAAPYSSTRIREALRAAKFEEAAMLLGRDWEIEMPVVHGDKRGRELGFPTANQQAGRYVRLPYGIYAVRVKIEGEDEWRGGVANFGIRPMFRIEQPIFETYIFGFDREIYGKNMRVKPLQYLRAEQAFEGLEALKMQIERDCHAAVSVLKSSSL